MVGPAADGERGDGGRGRRGRRDGGRRRRRAGGAARGAAPGPPVAPSARLLPLPPLLPPGTLHPGLPYGAAEGRWTDTVPRQETLLRRVQVPQVQAEVDERQLLGQQRPTMHQMPHQRVSAQTETTGEARRPGRQRPVQDTPAGALPEVPRARLLLPPPVLSRQASINSPGSYTGLLDTCELTFQFNLLDTNNLLTHLRTGEMFAIVTLCEFASTTLTTRG